RPGSRARRVQHVRDVAHPDREVRHGSPGATLVAKLVRDRRLLLRTLGCDPTVIYQYLESEHMLVEALRRRDIAGSEFADDPSDRHRACPPMCRVDSLAGSSTPNTLWPPYWW